MNDTEIEEYLNELTTALTNVITELYPDEPNMFLLDKMLELQCIIDELLEKVKNGESVTDQDYEKLKSAIMCIDNLMEELDD